MKESLGEGDGVRRHVAGVAEVPDADPAVGAHHQHSDGSVGQGHSQPALRGELQAPGVTSVSGLFGAF